MVHLVYYTVCKRSLISDPSFFQSETTRKSRDELHKFKYEKLEERLMELQTQCEILAEENIKLVSTR